jgi:anti-anti-sigma factor
VRTRRSNAIIEKPVDDDSGLAIRAYEEPDRNVLVLSGELDMGGVPAFESAAAQLCALGGEEILVDITDVDFIDSSGLRAILTVKALCEDHARRFSMTHGSGQAEKLFELTRLVELLPFRRSSMSRPRREIELTPASAGEEEQEPLA